MVETFYCRNLIGLILFFISFVAYPQDEIEPKQLFVEAESYFLFEEYKDALPLYQKILRAEPDNYNVIYKIGICYLNDIYQKQKAIRYFEQATQNINPDCRQNNYKEKQAPTDAHYYLGKAYHINNMLDQAIESYQQFRKLANPDAYDLDIVDEDIAACQLSKQLMKAPVYYSAKSIGAPVDTRFEEVNPVISGDGKTLVFTRKLQFYDGVFLAKKDNNGAWSEPENLTSSFGLDGSSYTTGLSFSGDEIFVYRSDNFDGNIYASKRKNNQWSKLVKLNENINTKYWESHASPSPDGQYLLFTSNRDGGYGGLDIYKSKRGSNGEWGTAVNLGPVINSPSNEETPFLSNEGYTLFFSSQGHKTIGGYDVFISNLRSDGTWSKPKNMGYPLNSTGDDIFYTPVGVDAFGLYSLYKEESTEGLLDIYAVEVHNDIIPRTYTVEGSLKVPGADADFYRKLRVKLYNAQSKELILDQEIAKDGSFAVQATQGDYILTIEGPGIEPYQKNINLSLNQPASIVKLSPITLIRVEIPAEPLIVETPEKEKILAKNDFYAVTNGSAVPIELLLPKGSNLHVEVSLEDSLIKVEDIADVKRKFTYFYTPLPGENLLKFTATDPEGNVSATEVIVTYYAAPAPAIAENIVEEGTGSSFNAEALGKIASGTLGDYLSKLDLTKYSNYYELYQHLIEVADKEGFTLADIQHLYSIYFTQKDLKTYSDDLVKEYSGNDSLLKQAAENSNIPLEYLNTLLGSKLLTDAELSNMLLSLIEKEGTSGSELFSRLIDFSGSGAMHTDSEIAGISTQQAWELFAGEQDDQKAGSILRLSSTTNNLDFFYQSLLLSATGSLNQYLAKLKLESLGLTNSISLSEFLFRNASDTTYRISELINALQLASTNKEFYLNKFNELLTANATGSLKSQLLLSSSEMRSYNTFEGMLDYLLNQAQYKNYTRESVYDLILSLIGIENVEEFAAKIKEYGYGSINQAITDTSLSFFSNPLELIQYLLMATQTYDFTQSDINNLLIRMILEKGLSDRDRNGSDDIGKKFWKSKRFIPTVILVNILLIILIILFTRRKKNQ